MAFKLTAKNLMVEQFLLVQRTKQSHEGSIQSQYPVLHAVNYVDVTLFHCVLPAGNTQEV